MSELAYFTYDFDGERLSAVRTGAPGRATVALLHGAGNGSKERLLPLLTELAGHGCHAVAFDFSGHGDSTGSLAELSPRHRFEQAVAVLDAHATDLVRHYGPRVAAVALCSPAVYSAEAWQVPFENGRGRFSEIIRSPDSRRTSAALEAYRAYAGRAVPAVPGTDAVIPPAVTEAVQDALSTRARYTRFELPHAEHRLGLWFQGHAEDRRRFVTHLLAESAEREPVEAVSA
ncbi:hypothetical protein SRB17_09280 [Streptomyces sp. RB17]|uniref:alpha/beta hydrolase n=1 Tax=Streptomyces sp. RB17 TaxID=2585197 RepID=UPI001297E5B9|nr:alpha/beta hydrolase [Streptomyces sp. RB17]MQY32968.1 hypothetical protein [Streptomyces sp. RB17]